MGIHVHREAGEWTGIKVHIIGRGGDRLKVHREVNRRQEPRFMERQMGDSNTGLWRGG